MSKQQRVILGILLAVVALDLAVTQRLTRLWNHAFQGKGTTSTSGPPSTNEPAPPPG